jgi:AcrR family transcriptional regulator
MAAPTGARSARKHAAIMDAATAAFLETGYRGTSMDEIAARAGVSKQTIYKHFTDKEGLFSALVVAAVESVNERVEAAGRPAAGEYDDVERAVRELARELMRAILAPERLALRRLVIAEAARFPELGGHYFERGFVRGLATLQSGLERLAERGLLRLEDPKVAATQLAGMALWTPANQAMFTTEAPPPDELERAAGAAARTFVAAYGS